MFLSKQCRCLDTWWIGQNLLEKKKGFFSIWVDNTDCLAIWLTCGGANILWKAEGENQKFPEEEELLYMWIFNHHHGKLNYCSLFFIAFKENLWTLGLAKENISGWDMTEAWKEPVHSGCSLCTSEIHHRKNFLQAAIAHSAWAPRINKHSHSPVYNLVSSIAELPPEPELHRTLEQPNHRPPCRFTSMRLNPCCFKPKSLGVVYYVNSLRQ